MTINDFQWIIDCWVRIVVPEQSKNTKFRAARFLEEALEASQSTGLSYNDALKVVHQVYARPKGELSQELAGCFTTLCALASSAELNLECCTITEITRILTPEIIEKVKSRQKYKVSPT